MPLTASECMQEASEVYLNDTSRARWPNGVLLPYLRSALLELQAELEDNDLPPVQEISAVITVNPGTFQLAAPADMVLPLRLEERAVGESRWEEVRELGWEPDADQDTKLNNWAFREGLVQFLGATTVRQVRLFYVRSLSTIAGENSNIELGNAKGFLAARTAGLAATFGGHATARGAESNARGDFFLKKIISALTKRAQDRPVRRRRYPWRMLSRK